MCTELVVASFSVCSSSDCSLIHFLLPIHQIWIGLAWGVVYCMIERVDIFFSLPICDVLCFSPDRYLQFFKIFTTSILHRLAPFSWLWCKFYTHVFFKFLGFLACFLKGSDRYWASLRTFTKKHYISSFFSTSIIIKENQPEIL